MVKEWGRIRPDGYEVSSKGDSRFSALNAVLHDGRTIEMHYQCDVKGYEPGGTNWRLGKGKAPINHMPGDSLWLAYLDLWKTWAAANPILMRELRIRSLGRPLTDMFATTDVNQARALATLLNEAVTATVHNLHKEQMQPGDVRIDRQTEWGNPFTMRAGKTHELVVTQFQEYAGNHFDIEDLAKLHGKRLFCWCKPHACHGDVLAEFAAMAHELAQP